MKIFTYIPFFSTGDININEVKSFKSYFEATLYADNMEFSIYEIVENKIIEDEI